MHASPTPSIQRRFTFLILLAALIIPAGVVLAADGDDSGSRGRAPACQGGTGSIAGKVTDAAGAPVEGATVRASGWVGRAEGTTAADGSYALTALCNGSYDVRAEKRGIGSGSYDADNDGHATPVTIADTAQAATGINIALGQRASANLCQGGTGTISGKVTDSAGAAVEGATVKSGSWAGKVEATTAADGSYTLSGLCHGVYTVSASKQGVGGGVYDDDNDGHSTPIVLTGAATSASGIDISLIARSGRAKP